MDYELAKQHALTLANLVAPNGDDQKRFVDLVREAEASGNEPKDVIRQLVGSIYDGLAFGNWPSVIARM